MVGYRAAADREVVGYDVALEARVAAVLDGDGRVGRVQQLRAAEARRARRAREREQRVERGDAPYL